MAFDGISGVFVRIVVLWPCFQVNFIFIIAPIFGKSHKNGYHSHITSFYFPVLCSHITNGSVALRLHLWLAGWLALTSFIYGGGAC